MVVKIGGSDCENCINDDEKGVAICIHIQQKRKLYLRN
jgi:hypothetical protein